MVADLGNFKPEKAERRFLRTVTLFAECDEVISGVGRVAIPCLLNREFVEVEGTGFLLKAVSSLLGTKSGSDDFRWIKGDASFLFGSMERAPNVENFGGMARVSLSSIGSESEFGEGMLIGLAYMTSTIFASQTSGSGEDMPSRSMYWRREGVTDGARETVDEFLEWIFLELLRIGISGNGLLRNSSIRPLWIPLCRGDPSGDTDRRNSKSERLEKGILGLRRRMWRGNTSSSARKCSSAVSEGLSRASLKNLKSPKWSNKGESGFDVTHFSHGE